MGRLATVCILVLLAVSACTPESDSEAATTTSTTVTPQTTIVTTTTEAPDGFGGEVVVGVAQAVTTLNPFSEDASEGTVLAGQAVWATTYDVLPNTWERVPSAVTSLPSDTSGGIEIGDDGSMTVRYQIHPDAKWSDGTPITGADMAFTAEQMAELALGGSPVIDPVMASVTATDALDRVAWVTFSEVSLAFEDALWVILPSHAIDPATDLRTADGFAWPAGGPFVVAQDQKPNTLVVERNPNFWGTDSDGEQLPYLSGLRFVPSNGAEDVMAAFVDGSVDIMAVPPGGEGADQLPAGAELQQAQSPLVEQLTFQFGERRAATNPQSNNDNRDYREAIAFSIDREAIVEGSGVPWSSEIPGMLLATGASAWERYPHDPVTGSDLVASLPDSDDSISSSPEAVLSTTSEIDDRIRVGEELVGSFADIGIDLDNLYLETLIFFGGLLGSGEFDVGMWAWPSDGGFAGQLALMDRFDAASDGNLGNWGVGESASEGSAAYSELVAEARSTTDPTRFGEIMQSAESILADSLPVIPLFRRTTAAALWKNRVSGVIHNGSRSDLTWNVETWQKPGE